MHIFIGVTVIFLCTSSYAMDNYGLLHGRSGLLTITTSDCRHGAIPYKYLPEMPVLASNPKFMGSLSKNEVDLLVGAFDAIKENRFERFLQPLRYEYTCSLYNKRVGCGQLRILISAAGKVRAKELSALCAVHFFPPEINQKIAAELFLYDAQQRRYYYISDCERLFNCAQLGLLHSIYAKSIGPVEIETGSLKHSIFLTLPSDIQPWLLRRKLAIKNNNQQEGYCCIL